MRLGSVLITASILLLTANGCARKFNIRSEPADAAVTINDVAVGKTPLSIPFSELPKTPNIRIQVAKENHGTFQGLLPSVDSATLGSDIFIAIPKSEDESQKFNRVMSMVFKAQQLALQKKEAEALKLTDEAIQEYPKFAALLLARASILFLSKNYQGALAQYQKVLEADPTNPEAARMVQYFKKRSIASTGNSANPVDSTGAKP